MRKRSIFYLTIKLLFLVLLVSCSGKGKKSISIFETTDVHGVILPYDFIEKKRLNAPWPHHLTILSRSERIKMLQCFLINGDNLQGQPEVYYYNFIDTLRPHFIAEVMNYMEYDACTVGNHDIEAGHRVYDRLVKEYNFHCLAQML